MGFSRRAPSDASIATESGDGHERMADGNLPHVLLPTCIDSHTGASTSLRSAPLNAGQESFIEASGSLGTAPSRRIRQSSLPHVAEKTTSTVIDERFSTTTVINFRAFAKQMDAVIKSNSAAKVIPFAEAIVEEVLR